MPVVILTAIGDLEARVAGLAAGADDFFTKPVAFVELRTRLAALLRVRQLLSQLERAEAVITTLALTIEARDPYTLGHCDRLSRYAVAVGEALGLDPEMVRSLRLGGYLHDLGKISVPDGILLKPGPLDPIEYERIRAHPGAGSDLVLGLRSMELVRPIMRHHHEKWDGSGYPDGLKGAAIPLGARIISVVDVFDALHTERPYKAALSPSRSEEHTSELQSRQYLVCRLLLEKKKNTSIQDTRVLFRYLAGAKLERFFHEYRRYDRHGTELTSRNKLHARQHHEVQR